MELYKTGHLGAAAKGYWQSITQTETIEYIVDYGISTRDDHSDRTERQEALDAELSAGVKFFGTGA